MGHRAKRKLQITDEERDEKKFLMLVLCVFKAISVRNTNNSTERTCYGRQKIKFSVINILLLLCSNCTVKNSYMQSRLFRAQWLGMNLLLLELYTK